MSDPILSEAFKTPGAMLDHLRTSPRLTDEERDEILGRIVEKFTPVEVVAAVRPRLADLSGGDAEAVLRLIEAYPEPDLLRELATAVTKQTRLPPERAWEAMAVLDAAGVLEGDAELFERWEELNDLLEGDDPVGQLVEQIEDDPDGLWTALQGLSSVEPGARPDIVAGLAGVEAGPGLIEFLRLVSYDQDAATRAAALGVLGLADPARPEVAAAWDDLATHHFNAAVAGDARRRATRPAPGTLAKRTAAGLSRQTPRLVRSFVSTVDGEGRGTVVLSAWCDRGVATAAFACDLQRGVFEVIGEVSADESRAAVMIDEFSQVVDRERVDDAHELALGLLAGSLTITGPDSPTSLRFWLESTTGPTFRPRPFPASFPGWDPESISFDDMPGRVEDVLRACPDWVDTSPLTVEMAEEIRLREGDSRPDPKRDAGAYRYLFEHGLRQSLERYRRMLLWMAWFWHASGKDDRARSALALSTQLSDAQHVVPGHPFTVALTTRSLAAAMQQRL